MKHNPFDSDDRRRRFDDIDLTRRILDRTSGHACARAEDLLGARWDGALEAVDQDLLAEHLAGCPACRELAVVLEHLQPLLPRLAERDLPRAFTTRVMAATVGLAGARPRPTPRLDGLATRLRDLGRELWGRPRFALEAAWTATALVALLMWSPLAPARTPASDAAEVVTAGADLAPQAVAWVQTRVDRAEDALSSLVHLSASEAAERLTDLGTAAQARGSSLFQHGRALVERLTGHTNRHDEPSRD
ncbi:MAG: zf-HC2 domain-containing protein [Candidatus Krumholzibacteriia bacterium]